MKIRIGTRKSRLALIQTELVKEKIEQAFPEAEVEVFKLSTKGDEQLDRSLTSFGGKGVFTRELEEALLLGEIDLAVHSAKDMPMEFPQGLEIGAVLERADVRDVFVTTSGVKAADLPAGSIVGTSSLRRELQIKAINPLVRIALLRGNVETRLRKLRKGQYDGILLAAAGLERLGLLKEPDLHLEYLDPDTFLPAAGQGILAVEAKEGRLTEVLSAIHCQEAALALEAERSFLAGIGGSCNAPAAGLCSFTAGEIGMKVMFAGDGKHLKYASCRKSIEESQAELSKAEERKSQDGSKLPAPEQMRQLGAEMAARVKQGKVWLLGAGPGDPALLTEKCLQCLRTADVIVYDNLVSASLLNEARPDAELIYAGKRASNHHLRQEETNELLIKKALEGKDTARLKGGDPFIFGRGGEEALELRKAGIEFEIVSGVSSSYAAAAYAGIPVTHRDFASSFHIITGHESNTKEGLALNYKLLAQEEGTLAFLMGLGNLPRIRKELIAGGKDPKTPAAVIQEGTTARQRTAVGTLATIEEEVKKAGIKTPAIILVGEVISMKEELDWFGRKPLFGIRVLLTGTKSMCRKQQEVLKAEGAEAVSFSLIRTKRLHSQALTKAVKELGGGQTAEKTASAKEGEPGLHAKGSTWLVFTSSSGVDFFFEELKENRKDIRSLAGIRFAVIGSGTKEALEAKGIYPDFVPSRYSSKDLAAEWIPGLTGKDRVLLLRAKEASRELTEALEQAEIPYQSIPLYTTETDRRKEEELKRMLPSVDYITFASASAVKAFVGMAGDLSGLKAKVICIGPVTEREARKAGLQVRRSAVDYTAEGIRDVLLREKQLT
ncbi:MAG: hydroxymethylbilane synthase [Lachnospiraceae bacterium]|jgi:uroporphyrinogen III methyltransferase/synthase|nr:hydroxymethylbilane synthase [Lachnospiraceae bacterium]MCI9624461.1 hydroxymethylbilane synthase [Lachnospiraceae bacterium]